MVRSLPRRIGGVNKKSGRVVDFFGLPRAWPCGMVRPMNVTDLIAALGGTREAAKVLGVKVALAHKWRQRGYIPPRYRRPVRHALYSVGLPFLDEYTDPLFERPSP